jgi:Glu-tRNA(Gln) amidotransferase subunit E-like FAD-binding protein
MTEFIFKPFAEMTDEDYALVGFKSGLEIHQQILTEKKLFCRCPAGNTVINMMQKYSVICVLLFQSWGNMMVQPSWNLKQKRYYIQDKQGDCMYL